jgi:hypothetical protein
MVRGRYDDAMTMVHDALEKYQEKLLGPEHPATLTADNLAMFRRLTREFQVSESLHRQIIPIFERTLGIEILR